MSGYVRFPLASEARLAAIRANPTDTARVIDVTAEEYHADPCAVPSLSSSIAHDIVAESPAHAYTHHPRLGAKPNGSTKPMHDGELLHALMLDAGRGLEMIDAADYRTNAAREARDQARANEKIPVLIGEFERMSRVAAILLDRCAELGYVFEGKSEVAVEWRDGDVLCRSMFDHAILGDGRIFDVKKCMSANPQTIARTFFEYGLDIQHAAYTRAVARLRPEFEGRVDMTFLFCEIEPPYSVVPAIPDGAMKEIGAIRWERAVRKWRECLASGRWPSYASERVVLESPVWVVQRELGAYEFR